VVNRSIGAGRPGLAERRRAAITQVMAVQFEKLVHASGAFLWWFLTGHHPHCG